MYHLEFKPLLSLSALQVGRFLNLVFRPLVLFIHNAPSLLNLEALRTSDDPPTDLAFWPLTLVAMASNLERWPQ